FESISCVFSCYLMRFVMLLAAIAIVLQSLHSLLLSLLSCSPGAHYQIGKLRSAQPGGDHTRRTSESCRRNQSIPDAGLVDGGAIVPVTRHMIESDVRSISIFYLTARLPSA